MQELGNQSSKSDRLARVVDEVLRNAPRLPYHNAMHALDVWSMSRQYALMEGISGRDIEVLEPAALLHDIIVVPGRQDNEEMSAAYAIGYLPTVGYSHEQSARVSSLILATKMPYNPKGMLEMIICDADVDNLGRRDFFEKGEAVRQEMGLPDGSAWYESQLRLLRAHHYFTRSANALRNAGKEENAREVMGALQAYWEFAEAYERKKPLMKEGAAA